VIRFYIFAKWECVLPWMAKALQRQFCNSNCIHLCPHITLNSTSNVNTVEWLVSIPAVQVFVDSAVSVCFGSAWARRDDTFDVNAFYVLFENDWNLVQWFSTWGPFACFLWVGRASDKYIHNYFYILYFVHGTTFFHTQNNGITWH